MDIRSVTPTICNLMHAAPPKISSALPLPFAVEPPKRPVDRCLVYCPDAVGTHLLRTLPDLFAVAIEQAPTAVRLRSMLPPKTPVCFASMFTGAMPEAHGIRVYERPVLTCDTLFDALGRAGRKVALVAVRDCSMDTIFRNRAIDYFSEPDDAAVTARALALLKKDRHDFICAYHQEYDDTLHRESHRSPDALAAARRHVDSFKLLSVAARSAWPGRPHAVMFCPDHGAHDGADGRGTHGEDIPADMDVTHFFSLEAR